MQPDERDAYHGDASAAMGESSGEPPVPGVPETRDGWAVDGPAVDSTIEHARREPLAVLVRELATPEAVPLARATLTRFAEREQAPETVRSALALAVTEACSNVVLHAYADLDRPGRLEVRAGRMDGALVVEVHDEGRGMVPRVDSPGLGVGLVLIANLADTLEIRTLERGLVVRMHFNVRGASR